MSSFNLSDEERKDYSYAQRIDAQTAALRNARQANAAAALIEPHTRLLHAMDLVCANVDAMTDEDLKKVADAVSGEIWKRIPT